LIFTTSSLRDGAVHRVVDLALAPSPTSQLLDGGFEARSRPREQPRNLHNFKLLRGRIEGSGFALKLISIG
jgi:hypothetical protein